MDRKRWRRGVEKKLQILIVNLKMALRVKEFKVILTKQQKRN